MSGYPLGLDAEFTPEEREVLETTEVDLARGPEPSVAAMIVGWARHVQRLYDERDTTLAGNRDAWGAHDWVAAMIIRGFAERSLAVLSGDLLTKARGIVDRYDSVLRSFTEPDSRGLVRHFAPDDAGQGWWWDLIPTTGPVREELTTYATRVGLP